MVRPEPLVPVSALEHHGYCARQCALIHVEGVWFDNEHTVRGEIGHRRVDSGKNRTERGHLVLRSTPIWSEAYGLTGRADAVEVSPAGSLVPIEYKIGSLHGNAPKLQLCAQALCLEEMTAVPVREGALWLAATRRRVRVEIGDPLRRDTLRAIEEIRATLLTGRLPPAPDDARCRACQFIDYCQPGVCASPARLSRYMAEVTACSS